MSLHENPRHSTLPLFAQTFPHYYPLLLHQQALTQSLVVLENGYFKFYFLQKEPKKLKLPDLLIILETVLPYPSL